ncbi:hypothetical protein V7114_18370 [Neobacillus niacini]|uniref:hypothetical protein n=1 Tax=Neobacillus niacini TaxID=86668 RepID=UPI0030006B1B
MLNAIEKQILDNVFEMQIYHGPKLKLDNYPLIEKDNPDYKSKWSEFGSYILKLRSLGYLKFEDSILTTGGRQNQKYRNNIINVWTDSLDIDKDGIAFVVKERETIKDKLVSEAKDIGFSLYQQVKTGLVGFVGGIIVSWIIGLF